MEGSNIVYGEYTSHNTDISYTLCPRVSCRRCGLIKTVGTWSKTADSCSNKKLCRSCLDSGWELKSMAEIF